MAVNLKAVSGKFKKNDINTESPFLDLCIKIRNNSFSISLYDKRDDFPFSIVKIPYLCNNISFKKVFSVFGADIWRIARTTSTCNKFRTCFKAFLNRPQNQNCNTVVL